MNTSVCQSCGSMSRLSSGICFNCGSRMTATSSGKLSQVLLEEPPAVVAPPAEFEASYAEQVIARLQWASVTTTEATPIAQVSPAAQVNPAARVDPAAQVAPATFDISKSELPALLSVSNVESTAPKSRVIETGDFFSEAPVPKMSDLPQVPDKLLQNTAIIASGSSAAAALSTGAGAVNSVSASSVSALAASELGKVTQVDNKKPADFSGSPPAVADTIAGLAARANAAVDSWDECVFGALETGHPLEQIPVEQLKGKGVSSATQFVDECRKALEATTQGRVSSSPEGYTKGAFFDLKNASVNIRKSDPYGLAGTRIGNSVLDEADGSSNNKAGNLNSSNSNSDNFVVMIPRKLAIFALIVFLFVAGWFAFNHGSPVKPVDSLPVTNNVSGPLANNASVPHVMPVNGVLPDTLFGQYDFVSSSGNGRISSGKLTLNTQGGEKIVGSAIINSEPFTVVGTVSGLRQLHLKFMPRATSSRAIRLDGVAIYDRTRMTLSGTCFVEPLRSWLNVHPATSKWGAKQTIAFDRADLINSNSFADSLNPLNLLAAVFWNAADSLPSRFIKILAFAMCAGISMVWLSVKFFGVQGLLNIWEKEKYIPSQVMRQHKKLMSELGSRKAASGSSLYLGERADWGLHDPFSPKKLYLPESMRKTNPHLLVLGSGAKGKSRLLAGLVTDDIRHADRAVVLIDSDGSLVELILNWIASQPDGNKLASRVHIIDPCKKDSLLGFNPLAVRDPETISSHAASIVMGFKAVYAETQNSQNQWTQQTANILRNALILLMLNDRTILDLPQLLSDNDFRDLLLQNVEREQATAGNNNGSQNWKSVLESWSNYKKLARSEQWINWIEPILNRIQPLLSEPRLSRLLNEKENGIDLHTVLEEKKILLVRVPEGQLHKGGHLLGSLVVTGLRQAAIEQYEENGKAQTCSLYLDELNNFIDADLFDAVCTETRKLQLGISGTLRTLQNLPEDFRNRALVTFGTIALFSISKKDADALGPSVFRVDGRKIRKWTIKDLFNQPNSTPTMETVIDEEKLNIDRLLGQSDRAYFCYLVGSIAGVFKMRAREFQDVSNDKINWDLVDRAYECKSNEALEPDDE